MNFFLKNKGNITMFLTIILVPIIAVCTIFVDVSRIWLAKGLAQSSEELALNTVLTQYDEELADYFGLIASCQDIESFYEVANQYFVDCMVSQDVSLSLAQEVAGDLELILRGENKISDFIAVDTGKTSAQISAVENANLSNPLMLKEEIVDFMKYRAPIILIEGALEGETKGFLGKITEMQKTLEVMPKEADIENKKVEYYEAESEVMQRALEIYESMIQYDGNQLEEYEQGNDDAKYTVLSGEYLIDSVQKALGVGTHDTYLYGIIGDYYKLHDEYVRKWANTGTRRVFKTVDELVNERRKSAITFSNADETDLKSAIACCEEAKNKFEQLEKEIRQKLDEPEISKYAYAYDDPDSYEDIQYWIQLDDILSEGSLYDRYIDNIVEYFFTQDNLKACYEDATRLRTKQIIDYDYVLDENGEKKKDQNGNDLKKITITTEEYYNVDPSDSSYKNAVQELTTPFNYADGKMREVFNKLNEISIGVLDSGENNLRIIYDADGKIKEASKKLYQEYRELIYARNLLLNLKKNVEDKRIIGKNFKDLVAEYNEKYEIWKNTVEENENLSNDSPLIKNDLEEIKNIEGEIVKKSEDDAENLNGNPMSPMNIKAEDVDAFIEKIDSVVEVLNSYINAIESIQYHNKDLIAKYELNETDKSKIHSEWIDSFTKFDAAARQSENAVELDKIPVLENELKTYINSTWSFDYAYDELVEITTGADGNDPKFHEVTNVVDGTKVKSLKGNVDSGVEELDRWLHEKFDELEMDSEEVKNALKMLKQLVNAFKKMIDGLEDYREYENKYVKDAKVTNIANESNLPSSGRDANLDSPFPSEESEGSDEDTPKNTLEASKNVGKLFGNIGIADIAVQGRDNLYAIEYVMNMFTYETYALERLYNTYRTGTAPDKLDAKVYMVTEKYVRLDKDEAYSTAISKKMYPGTAEHWYDVDDILTEEPSENAKWWDPSKTFSKNKSLTNNMLNRENTIAYGREVEYILYGGSSEDNRKKIGTTLFFTRYAMNIAPVFINYWKNTALNDLATSIATVTHGIVPAPLVKLLFIMGINAAESAVDLNFLRAGLPVPLLKSCSGNKNNLFINIEFPTNSEEFAKSLKGKTPKNMQDLAKKQIQKSSDEVVDVQQNDILLSYSDYLKLFLFISLCTNEDAVYERIGDVIQVTMAKKIDGYMLENAKTVFMINADVRVKPMMMALPYARQSGITISDTDTWNTFHDVLYKSY